MKQLVELIEELGNRKIQFESIEDSIDTSTSVGNFFFHVIASFSELERNLIVERTQKGLESARKRGRRGGRPDTHNKEKKETAKTLYYQNKMSVKDIANTLGMSRMTVYRALGC